MLHLRIQKRCDVKFDIHPHTDPFIFTTLYMHIHIDEFN